MVGVKALGLVTLLDGFLKLVVPSRRQPAKLGAGAPGCQAALFDAHSRNRFTASPKLFSRHATAAHVIPPKRMRPKAPGQSGSVQGVDEVAAGISPVAAELGLEAAAEILNHPDRGRGGRRWVVHPGDLGFPELPAQDAALAEEGAARGESAMGSIPIRAGASRLHRAAHLTHEREA